jgi:hypothetical protein
MAVLLEGAVMDLYIRIPSMNSSALEVACPPPGIGAKKVQESSETGTTYFCGTIAQMCCRRSPHMYYR